MEKKLVTLLRPPIVSSLHSFSIPVTPPLALAYLTSTLEEAGIEVDPIDALGEDLSHIEPASEGRKLQGMSFQAIVDRIRPNTDILGVSTMFSQEWPLIRELITKIRQAHPHLTIIAGGEHITALPEFCLKDCPALDYCGLGEGEDILLDFVRTIRSGGDVKTVEGLYFREGEGFFKTEPRKRIKDVDKIPWPAWDRLPIEAYLTSGYSMGTNNGRNMPMLATRGCPYQCTFCSNPVMYEQRYFMRAPEDVIEEIKHYTAKYKASFIEFYDLTAIIKKEWIVKFCRLYLDKGLTINWSLPSGTRSEALDAEVLSLLYRTNCRYLVYAPESGSVETLKEIKKQVKLDKLLSSVSHAIALGINTRCNLIIGFPKETKRQLFETLKFQVKLAWIGVDDAPLYMFSPYPGSALFDYLRGSGQIKNLDTEYFNRLLAQMDLGVSETYCEDIDGKTLRLYRIAGMSLFYGLSYLFRPMRILRSLNNIFIRKRTDSVFEQRVLEMLKRRPAAAVSA
ncbi:MAG: B12-binding domain-containing radical SAM protein [Elusimicrobiota bacterium]